MSYWKEPPGTARGELDEQPHTSPLRGFLRHARLAGATLVIASLTLGPEPMSANAATNNGDRYFLLWPHIYQDVIQNWHIDFVPTSEKDYAFQIQIAGKDDENPPKLACDKLEANHYRSIALKDING